MSETNLEESEEFTAHVPGGAMVLADEGDHRSLAESMGKAPTTRQDVVDHSLDDNWLMCLAQAVVPRKAVELP